MFFVSFGTVNVKMKEDIEIKKFFNLVFYESRGYVTYSLIVINTIPMHDMYLSLWPILFNIFIINKD